MPDLIPEDHYFPLDTVLSGLTESDGELLKLYSRMFNRGFISSCAVLIRFMAALPLLCVLWEGKERIY